MSIETFEGVPAHRDIIMTPPTSEVYGGDPSETAKSTEPVQRQATSVPLKRLVDIQDAHIEPENRKLPCEREDPELFFSQAKGDIARAQAVCRSCVKVENCGQTALNDGIEFGVWGGLSERQRRRLKRNKV